MAATKDKVITEVDPETGTVVGNASIINPPVQPPSTPPVDDTAGIVVAGGSTPQQTTGQLTPIEDSFSWDKKAVEGASIMEKIDIATAEQNALASRQNIEKNAGMGQTQAMLGKYSANQAQERMGWTGGYALDSNMQMEFLKAQIQADMYGQLELQKMGYESQLSIARLNYELNMNQLAHQYYMDAQNLEIQRAQFVGEYISPENRELITQYQAAQAALLTNPADNRARAIVDQIEQWYQAEGLDREGIQGLIRIANLTRNEQQYEMNEAQLEEYEWKRITANEEARREILDDYKIPVEVWSGGEPGKGVMTLVAIDPGTTNSDDMAKVYDYFKNNPAYYEEVLDSLANQQIAWAEAAGKDYGTWLQDHLNNGGVDKVAEFIDRYKALDEEGILPDYIDPMGIGYEEPEEPEDDGDDESGFIINEDGELVDESTDEVVEDAPAGYIEETAATFFLKDKNGTWLEFDSTLWTREQVETVFNNPNLVNSTAFTNKDARNFKETMDNLSATFNQGDDQTALNNGIQTAIGMGLIPDDTYINVNYGKGDAKYMWYYNGNLYDATLPANTAGLNIIGSTLNSVPTQTIYNHGFSTDFGTGSSKTVVNESTAFLSTLIDALGHGEKITLGTGTKSSDFGSFKDNGKAGSGQETYVNEILTMARNNMLPEYSIINMNYGKGDPVYYVYINKEFYKVKGDNIADKASNPIVINNTNYKDLVKSGFYTSSFYNKFTGKEDTSAAGSDVVTGSATHNGGYSYGRPPQNPTVGQKWADLEWNGTTWVKQSN